MQSNQLLLLTLLFTSHTNYISTADASWHGPSRVTRRAHESRRALAKKLQDFREPKASVVRTPRRTFASAYLHGSALLRDFAAKAEARRAYDRYTYDMRPCGWDGY